MNPLNHVAIIMDGNGRWGIKNKNSRNQGHKAGLKTVETIIKETIKNNIKFLTLYAFSTENWNRVKSERIAIFGLPIPILLEKLITFFKICIFVFTFGNTFNAPSVMISGLSSLSKVMCQI